MGLGKGGGSGKGSHTLYNRRAFARSVFDSWLDVNRADFDMI